MVRNIVHKERDRKLWGQAESTEDIEGKGRIGNRRKGLGETGKGWRARRG